MIAYYQSQYLEKNFKGYNRSTQHCEQTHDALNK